MMSNLHNLLKLAGAAEKLLFFKGVIRAFETGEAMFLNK